MAKQASLRYRGGQRAIVNVKAYETADLVVGGYSGPQEAPRGLLLGAFDAKGRLHYVGATNSFSDRHREELTKALPQLLGGRSFTGIQPGDTRWGSATGTWPGCRSSRVSSARCR